MFGSYVSVPLVCLDAPELVLQRAVSLCVGSGRAVYLTAEPPVWPPFLKMGFRMGLEATRKLEDYIRGMLPVGGKTTPHSLAFED